MRLEIRPPPRRALPLPRRIRGGDLLVQQGLERGVRMLRHESWYRSVEANLDD